MKKLQIMLLSIVSLPKILKLQASYKIEKENELTWKRNKKYDEL